MVKVCLPQVPALLMVPATAFALAAGPVTLPSVAPRALPVVQVDEIQLAGIGQDIYNAITPVVQTVVGDVSYLINFIPILGGIAAAQININYFQGIQPSVAATVNYAAALLHNPLNFFPITKAYIDTLVGIGYDLVSAQLRFLGFNELPPRPAGAKASPRRGAAAAARTVIPKAVAAEADDASEIVSNRAAKRLQRATAKAAAAAATRQGRKSAETRRHKSTTGRTSPAI